MPSKSDLIREVLTVMPDASAPEIVDEVYSRYGVTVADGSVRAVKSRDGAKNSAPPRQAAANSRRAYKAPRAAPRILTPQPPRLRVAPEPEPGGWYPDNEPEPVIDPSDWSKADLTEVEPEDAAIYALMDNVERAIERAIKGEAQKVTGDRELIRNISEILDDPEIRSAHKGYGWNVQHNMDGTQTLIVRSDIPSPYRATGRGARKKEPACEFCGRQQGYSTPNLYLVHGGAIGERQRLLCALHAQGETAAGAVAVPYRVLSGTGYVYAAEVTVLPEPRYARNLKELARSFMTPRRSLAQADGAEVYDDGIYAENE